MASVVRKCTFPQSRPVAQLEAGSSVFETHLFEVGLAGQIPDSLREPQGKIPGHSGQELGNGIDQSGKIYIRGKRFYSKSANSVLQWVLKI